MLDVQDLCCGYGRKQIIHQISMAARPGALTAIVGPNGSGKTTLMRALTGEIAAQAGQIRLQGQDIARLPPARLALMRGVLPQDLSLGFPFTVAEVVRLGLSAGLEAGKCARIGAVLAQVGLAGFAPRFYQELSGGERQRVQLARVLAQIGAPQGPEGPRWLFLDEPVSSLDIGHQLQVMRLAADFAAQGGGVVAVMHDLNLTAMFAQHLVLMAEGRVLRAGPPAAVLTDGLLSRAYGCALRVNAAPRHCPFILPQGAGAGAAMAG